MLISTCLRLIHFYNFRRHNAKCALIVYTMSVFDLKKGQSGKIIKISSGGAVAARLSALGIVCGQIVTALGFSLFNSGILAGVGATRVAIRRAVAKSIEVELCK